jgi:ribosomal protein S18 acetylase RimI-like enzyme
MPITTVRFATMSDAAALRIVFHAAYAPYKKRIKDLPDVSGGLADDIANHTVWVAEIDAHIVGGLVLARQAGVFHLANIAVSPDCHGHGIGRALISTAENYAVASGGLEIALATHIDMPENVELYQRLGWRETGRADNKILMTKKIGPKPES